MNQRDRLMIELGTTENFKAFLNSLCLTDRQKKIALCKYLRGWSSMTTAVRLDISERTVTSEMKIIREIIGKAQLKMESK